MRFLPVLLLYALLGLGPVSAQATFKTTLTVCQTAYGSTKVSPISTGRKSYAASATVAFALTTTPVVKVTPTPVTKTATTTIKTTTTVAGSAGTTSTLTTTFTTTTTQVVVLPTPVTTETVTETSTESATQTVTYSSASVVPVQNTLPGSMTKKKKRSRVIQRQAGNAADSSSTYPQSVACAIITKTIIVKVTTKTAPAKTVTLCPATTIKTTTVTKTSTKTTYPPNTATTVTVTNTVTDTATSTPAVLTTTTTTTTTTTFVAAVQTVYPQCNPPNQASTVNGQGIANSFSARGSPPFSVLVNAAATNANQCCIQCLEDPTCGVTYFDANAQGGPRCLAFIPTNGCDAANPILLNVFTTDAAPVADIISNGKCGTYIPR